MKTSRHSGDFKEKWNPDCYKSLSMREIASYWQIMRTDAKVRKISGAKFLSIPEVKALLEHWWKVWILLV